MTALGADTPLTFDPSIPPLFNELPVLASTKIYQGAAVAVVKASGYARPATGDTSAEYFVGFAERQADNSSGASGAIRVVVRSQGIVEKTVTGGSIDDIGKTVYADNDNDLTLTLGAGTADVPVGKVFRYISGAICKVAFKGENVA